MPKRPLEDINIEINPETVEAATQAIRERIRAALDKAQASVESTRYIKVSIGFRGRTIVRDLPLATLLGAEGLAFVLMSPLSAILVNLGANALLEIQFTHESDEFLQRAKAEYLQGELDAARLHLAEALKRRPEDPAAWYQLGVIHRVRGEASDAERCFKRAVSADPDSEDGQKAGKALERGQGKKNL